MNEDIDFVIIWVDGSDPEWLAEKAKYSPQENTDDRPERYRDWNTLRYWFRGVEQFAPWVRKIHFVTWGHLPKWLNINHPKLHIVKHSDYIPEKYLPTFNANPIELNLHRIEGLSEKFVYFNDDTFIIRKIKPETFFKNGLPCDSAVLNVHCYDEKISFHFSPFRAIGVINKYFEFKPTIKANFFKWINPLYGFKNLRTAVLLGCPRFPGMWQHHLPSSFLKSTFTELWEKEYEYLDETCSHKFRSMTDFNQWLMKEWQLAKGKFYPRSINTGKSFDSNTDGKQAYIKAARIIEKQRYKMICVNDGDLPYDELEESMALIENSFLSILPNKSDFEV